MINNLDLIARCEANEALAYKFYIDFADGLGDIDITDYVRKASVESSDFNDKFEAITSTASITIATTSYVYSRLMVQAVDFILKIYVVVAPANELLFYGKIKHDGFTANRTGFYKSEIAITAVDRLQELRLFTLPTAILQNYVPCSYSGNSVVHYICNAVFGLTTMLSVTYCPAISGTIPAIVFDGTTTALEELQKLFLANGYAFQITGQYLKIYPIQVATIASVYTIDSNIQTSNKGGIISDYTEVDIVQDPYTADPTGTNRVLYTHSAYDDDAPETLTSTNECYITIASGATYPDDGGYITADMSITTSTEADVTNAQNLSLSVVTIGAGALTVDYLASSGKVVNFRLKNNTAYAAIIMRCRVLGDAVYKTAITQSSYPPTGTDSNIYTIDSNQYIITTAQAEAMAKKIWTWLTVGTYDYEIDTRYLGFLETGDIIHVTDSASNIDGDFLVRNAKQKIEIASQYTTLSLKPLEAYVAPVDDLTLKTQRVTVIDTDTTKGVILQVLASVGVTTETTANEGTVNPQYSLTNVPLAVAIANITKNMNIISFDVARQSTLTNFLKYQLQMSTDGVTWSDFLGNVGSYHETVLSKIVVRVPYATNVDGDNVDTNYYFRVRQVTAAASPLYSPWTTSALVIILADLSAEFTNVLGSVHSMVLAGNLTIDTYNYWDGASGIFRIGNATQYLLWDGSDIQMRGADLNIEQGTLETYGATYKAGLYASQFAIKNISTLATLASLDEAGLFVFGTGMTKAHFQQTTGGQHLRIELSSSAADSYLTQNWSMQSDTADLSSYYSGAVRLTSTLNLTESLFAIMGNITKAGAISTELFRLNQNGDIILHGNVSMYQNTYFYLPNVAGTGPGRNTGGMRIGLSGNPIGGGIMQFGNYGATNQAFEFVSANYDRYIMQVLDAGRVGIGASAGSVATLTVTAPADITDWKALVITSLSSTCGAALHLKTSGTSYGWTMYETFDGSLNVAQHGYANRFWITNAGNATFSNDLTAATVSATGNITSGATAYSKSQILPTYTSALRTWWDGFCAMYRLSSSLALTSGSVLDLTPLTTALARGAFSVASGVISVPVTGMYEISVNLTAYSANSANMIVLVYRKNGPDWDVVGQIDNYVISGNNKTMLSGTFLVLASTTIATFKVAVYTNATLGYIEGGTSGYNSMVTLRMICEG